MKDTTDRINQIKTAVDQIFDEIVAYRRHLHQHPELSQQEVETSRFISAKLDAMGIPYETNIAGYGIVATIYGQNKNHAVGIRADMDALPLTEMADVLCKSRTPGIMHGCGHDIHSAILLGTGKILNEMKEDLSGSVKLFFQPSEETIGGAAQMIEAGCLEGPKVSSVIGLHVESTVDAGSVQFIPGAMNAASCEFEVTVTGRSCHGAHPSAGIDSLLPACTMATSLQSIITRQIDPTESALITIGQFHSGTKNNIISGETKFSGIIRTLNMENRELIKNSLAEICQSTAKAFGAICEVKLKDSYPSLENDEQLLTLVKASSAEILGEDQVLQIAKPSLGADDFAYFCHSARGLYYNIGSRFPGEKNAYPIHSDKFCPDEECIRTGMLTEVAAVLKILEEESKTW